MKLLRNLVFYKIITVRRAFRINNKSNIKIKLLFKTKAKTRIKSKIKSKTNKQ